MDESRLVKLVRQVARLTVSWSWWKAFVLGVLVANLKSLPLIWHFRIFRGIMSHYFYRPAHFTPSVGSKALFQPLITSSRCTLSECDFNGHKSNSTYFSDLDISRLHLVTCLIKGGVDQWERERKGTNKSKFGIILGGVACSFKREIKPYQAYEIWSRVLCWDRKWLYIVSHFVEKGTVRPSGYTLQPWNNAVSGRSTPGSEQGPVGLPTASSKGVLFATATAKYVIKEGRMTVPPERFWHTCGLLPPRPPEASSSPSRTSSPSLDTSTVDLGTASQINDLTPSAEGLLSSSLIPEGWGDAPWTWERIEEERLKGIAILEAMEGLDNLHDAFTGHQRPALGEYTDLL